MVFFFVLLQTKQQTNPNFLGLALPCSSIYNPNAIVFLEYMVMCYGMGPVGTIPPRNAQRTWQGELSFFKEVRDSFGGLFQRVIDFW
jgi:hypothetical protein